MKEFCKGVAVWFFIWAAYIVLVAAGLAALGLMVVAVPVLALMGRVFTFKRTRNQVGSGRVLEGEYRVVDGDTP